jgi:hypothetical protein
MSKVEQLEQMIEQLPKEDFEKLSAWMEQRQIAHRHIGTYPQHAAAPLAFRDHSASLSSYVPEDEGLYDDASGATSH